MSENNNENGWWCHSCGKSYGAFDTPGWSSMRGPLCCCTDQTPDKRDIDRWTVCIPIATICNPPEPTTIDDSDLAPGMVVVAVDDHDGPYREWMCTPDAHLALGRYQQLVWARRQDPHWHRDGVIVDRHIRSVAGKGRP